MRALQLQEWKSEPVLTEVPVPVPGPGEALVRVEAVGICASDLKCYHGATKFWGDAQRAAYVETPVTPGHEFVGRVVALTLVHVHERPRLVAACDDDAPSTNTVGEGPVSPTETIDGNVDDVTGGTPVAAGDDSIVQGNQPMLSSAVP